MPLLFLYTTHYPLISLNRTATTAQTLLFIRYRSNLNGIFLCTSFRTRQKKYQLKTIKANPIKYEIIYIDISLSQFIIYILK